MTDYIGILDCTDGAWGVRIPDLPGCYGAGGSHEQAMADAVEAAREWIAHQRARGVAIPIPRSIEAVLADPASEFDAATEAAVVIEPERSQRASTSTRAPAGVP